MARVKKIPQPLDPNISESMFRAKIIELARKHGWRTYYGRPQRGIPAGTMNGRPVYYLVGDKSALGWPDLVLSCPGRVLFRELKTEASASRLEPEQAEWIALLQDAGLDAGVWRPRQWMSEIVPTLTGVTTKVMI